MIMFFSLFFLDLILVQFNVIVQIIFFFKYKIYFSFPFIAGLQVQRDIHELSSKHNPYF